jgi:hypothetical protein
MVVDLLDQTPTISGAPPLFPAGERRFQAAGTLPDLRIAGVRSHAHTGGPSVEWLDRGGVWTRGSAGWTHAPLLPEGSGSPRAASLAMDLNADGVVVGAYGEPDTNNDWRWHACVWRPTSGGLVRHALDSPEGCQPLASVALGAGPGAAPAVAGYAFTRCGEALEEPFTALLESDPGEGGIMASALGTAFQCDFEQPVVSGVARAIVSPAPGQWLAVGHRLIYGGQVACNSILQLCDATSAHTLGAHGWWAGATQPADLTLGRIAGYRLWASDGEARAPVEGDPGWSIAGGWLRQQTPSACFDRAAVYLGYIPGTPGHMSSGGNPQGGTYPLHGTVVPSLPDDDQFLPSSKIAHARRTDDGHPGARWLACGARYGQRDYGILWAGRDDGDGGIEWCGRNVNDEDVAWMPSIHTFVTSLTDILANGVAIGIASQQGESSRLLVVLTDIADMNGDFVVGGADLGQLLSLWGQTSSGEPWNPADLDRDGVVGGSDLGTLLARWTDGAIVQVAPPCETWSAIGPLDIDGALLLLGFDGCQHLGDELSALPIEAAEAAVQYIHFLAQIIHQEAH